MMWTHQSGLRASYSRFNNDPIIQRTCALAPWRLPGQSSPTDHVTSFCDKHSTDHYTLTKQPWRFLIKKSNKVGHDCLHYCISNSGRSVKLPLESNNNYDDLMTMWRKISPNVTVEWLVLPLRIREVRASNLSLETGNSDWGVVVLLSPSKQTPGYYLKITPSLIPFTSFPIHYSAIILSLDAM
jgi:hypothetical protein